jgi:hypothetical protein
MYVTDDFLDVDSCRNGGQCLLFTALAEMRGSARRRAGLGTDSSCAERIFSPQANGRIYGEKAVTAPRRDHGRRATARDEDVAADRAGAAAGLAKFQQCGCVVTMPRRLHGIRHTDLGRQVIRLRSMPPASHRLSATQNIENAG